MISDVEALRFLKCYTWETYTHPISYIPMLLGRGTLSCRIPGGGQGSSGFPAQPPAWTFCSGSRVPSVLPSQFCILQGWRSCHHFEQPVPGMECGFSFSWYWARISCVVTWVHCLTSLVKLRLDHNLTNPIEFIWTFVCNFIVNCSGDRTAI